jgi:hypothetical protein
VRSGICPWRRTARVGGLGLGAEEVDLQNGVAVASRLHQALILSARQPHVFGGVMAAQCADQVGVEVTQLAFVGVVRGRGGGSRCGGGRRVLGVASRCRGRGEEQPSQSRAAARKRRGCGATSFMRQP